MAADNVPCFVLALFFGVPGITILFSGIRTLVTKKMMWVARNRYGFGWLLPKIIRGKSAETIGKIDIGLGSLLLVISILFVFCMFL